MPAISRVQFLFFSNSSHFSLDHDLFREEPAIGTNGRFRLIYRESW
jgi:hypothetical protein